MRHRVGGFKLGRDSEHRIAMRRNMAIAFFTHGQITTTIPKAKSVKPLIERIITFARKGDLASRRQVIKLIGDHYAVAEDVKQTDNPDYKVNRYGELLDAPRVVKKLFDEIGPRFADRQGGYTRLIRLGKHRIGDAADLCVLQLVGDDEGPQVSGQYSRRREKADRRMTFAAKLRKGEEPTAQAASVATETDETPGDEEQSS